jgi:DNA repair protein RecO (recombination protein O)
MNFNDQAIILAKQFKGEGLYLFSLLTANNGMINSYSKVSGKKIGLFQTGNLLNINFKQKSGRKYGNFSAEIIQYYPIKFNENSQNLLSLQLITSLFLEILAEYNHDIKIYNLLYNYLYHNEFTQLLYNTVQIIIKFLEYNGYGLSLESCVVSGKRDNLYYLSPKTGCVVTKIIGEDYDKKLFKIPQIFSAPKGQDARYALEVLQYFVHKFLYNNQTNINYKNSKFRFYLEQLLSII